MAEPERALRNTHSLGMIPFSTLSDEISSQKRISYSELISNEPTLTFC